MRIIAGSARGRRLMAPEGETTRPTSDRVRESVFNMLFSLGGVEDAQVLDLFAGTGAYGLEALSRGAAHAIFVESNRSAAAVLADNVDTLGFEDRCEIVIGDASRWLDRSTGNTIESGGTIDIAFCDPPYDFDDWASLLTRLNASLCVAESRSEIDIPAGWGVLRSKSYASTLVTLLDRQVEA